MKMFQAHSSVREKPTDYCFVDEKGTSINKGIKVAQFSPHQKKNKKNVEM